MAGSPIGVNISIDPTLAGLLLSGKAVLRTNGMPGTQYALVLGNPGGASLNWFAVFYGLDWIATVPPTVRLTTSAFGTENTGVVYGWIGAAHQLGASLAALIAGTLRTMMGDYRPSFWAIGLLCFLTGFVFLFFRGALETKSESVLELQPVGV